MAINNSYDEQAVIKAIASALEVFYGSLIEKIDGLDIVKVMKRKNPYLYRAKAMENAAEIVESVLSAFVSSSEETIFGNCFFEPIAIAASGGNTQIVKSDRNRILWPHQNWHNRLRQGMKHILVIVMARRKRAAGVSLRCTGNLPENSFGQSLPVTKIFI